MWCINLILIIGVRNMRPLLLDLKQKLLDTGDAFLVECARTDKIWACGIRLDDDKRFDAANWDGENILGFALMEVRRRLAAQ